MLGVRFYGCSSKCENVSLMILVSLCMLLVIFWRGVASGNEWYTQSTAKQSP